LLLHQFSTEWGGKPRHIAKVIIPNGSDNLKNASKPNAVAQHHSLMHTAWASAVSPPPPAYVQQALQKEKSNDWLTLQDLTSNFVLWQAQQNLDSTLTQPCLISDESSEMGMT
jgi:hypothetical protein